MCVIRITCSKRSCNPRSSSTTLNRRASSSEPKTSSRINSEKFWPARSAIICEIARRSTRFATSSSPPEIRLRRAVLENDDVVLIVELELHIARVGQVREERAGELRELWPQREIEVGAEIRVRAVELIVQPLVAAEHIELRLHATEIGLRDLRRSDCRLRREHI